MGVGRKKQLSTGDKARVEAAVSRAEKHCGLQFLVYVGETEAEPRQEARDLLVSKGYHAVPGVVLLVAPTKRRVEIVTSEMAQGRVSDDACRQAIETMAPAFQKKDWIAGLELGLAALAESAGPGIEEGEELPDLLE